MIKTVRYILFCAIVLFSFFLSLETFASDQLPEYARSRGSESFSEPPLIRAPGLTQDQLEAFAEAQGRLTLADQLDLSRPGQDWQNRLHRLVERAQSAWLSGSVDSARVTFKEITKVSLEADWREPQREAIHYAHLRLAQTSATATERNEWIEKAIATFPDLQADGDTFPPPLVDAFQAARSRMLALAQHYSPYSHFPEYRFLLVNGKKFVIAPELKIRLPGATYRVTALSDAFPPLSERLSVSQLSGFHLNLPALVSGNCGTPNLTEQPSIPPQVAVVFSMECVRTKTPQGWMPFNADESTQLQAIDDSIKNPGVNADLNQSILLNSMNESKPAEKAPAVSKKSWILIGATVIAIGAAYAISTAMNRSSGGPSASAPQPPVAPAVTSSSSDNRPVPSHHDGF